MSSVSQSGLILAPPRRHLECLKTFLVITTQWEGATSIQRVEARHAARPPKQRTGQHSRSVTHPAPKVNRARVEKPGFRLNPTSRIKGEGGVC